MSFDPKFYKTKYSIKPLFSNVYTLRSHFVVSRCLVRLLGKRRYGNANDWLSSLEAKFGPLPTDFDTKSYQNMYPDLHSAFLQPWQAKAHYIEHGRAEGRSYLPMAVPANASGPVWLTQFNTAEFIALNPSLAAEVNNKEDALKVFFDRGIDEIAQTTLNSTFDPVFYGDYYQDTKYFTPANAYRHWLFKGSQEGKVGSETDLLREKLIGRTLFPSAFDWNTYAKRLAPLPDNIEHTRWNALEHLLRQGFEEGREIPLLDGDAAYLFECIADFCWGIGKRESAKRALRMGVDCSPNDGHLHHKLGDYLTETSAPPSEARAEYKRAYTLGYKSLWTYLALAKLAVSSSDFESAYGYMKESRDAFSGERPWIQSLNDIILQHYVNASNEAISLFKLNEKSLAAIKFETNLKRITQAYQELDDLPPPLSLEGPGHVVMFSLLTVPQCRHYRVEQRLQQFEELGIEVRAFGGHEPQEAASALIGATALIIYREPAIPTTIKLILHAKALGIRVFYEIDDLIFDFSHYPEPIENYGTQVTPDEYIGLLCGVTLYRYAMSLCDEGITTTKQLSTHIEPVVTKGICHVIPNGLDSRNEPFIDRPVTFTKEEELFIFYGSGTTTHNRNFNECVAPAISALMRHRVHIKLVIVGYLDLDDCLLVFQDRIIRVAFCHNISEYWSLLSAMHINIAVLTAGEMNDCKSEIKWLEAAVVGVPSIVSASATYKLLLEDGVDALLVHSVNQWRDALFRLADDASLRAKIGKAARRKAKDDYALAANSRKLRNIFDSTAEPQRKARRPEQFRVLIVNVFFPPQTLGGATRVVRDTVDDLGRRYAEVCEVAVYTTDFGEVAGRSRVGGYGDIPVFRFAPATTPEAAFDFENQAIAKHFANVLQAWRPDVVHIHCVQYLSASIAKVCRQHGVPYAVTLHDGWWLSPFQFFINEDGLLRLPAPGGASELNRSQSAVRDLRRKHYLVGRLQEAYAVTAVSEVFGQIYAPVINRDVRTIENGLGPEFIRNKRPPRTRTGQRVRIGHIGGLAIQKGAFLLEAALRDGRYGNIETLVIDHTKDETFSRATLWGATSVTIRGKMPPDRVTSLYDGIDVLIAPSIWPESYGLVAREALAMGLWLVASDLGAMGTDVIDGVNGFKISVHNTVALCRVLRIIDNNPEIFLKPPNSKFTPRSFTQQTDEYVALYEEMRISKLADASDFIKSQKRQALAN